MDNWAGLALSLSPESSPTSAGRRLASLWEVDAAGHRLLAPFMPHCVLYTLSSRPSFPAQEVDVITPTRWKRKQAGRVEGAVLSPQLEGSGVSGFVTGSQKSHPHGSCLPPPPAPVHPLSSALGLCAGHKGIIPSLPQVPTLSSTKHNTSQRELFTAVCLALSLAPGRCPINLF